MFLHLDGIKYEAKEELVKDYTCTILYHLGKANVIVDTLSRNTYLMKKFLLLFWTERYIN